jgi:hypothetical protein
MEFNEYYKSWFTFYERFEFSREAQSMDSIIPARMINDKIGSVVMTPEDNALPPLNVFTSFNPSRRIVSLHKRKDGENETICLQYQFSFFEDEEGFAPGDYTLFEGSISIGKKALKPEKEKSAPVKLANKNLRFIFERGRGRLFCNERELTKGLGIYSSLRVNGIWHDSSQAIWKLEDNDRKRFVAYGKWFFLPIYQKWLIEIVKNRILWRIDTQIQGDFKPEIEQVNIMAAEEYKEWGLSNGIKGTFEDIYTDDYDILPFRYCYVSLKEPVINIEGKGLSALSFKCSCGNGFKALIENSDYFYKARMLQYQKSGKNSQSNKYRFFEGEIALT